MSKDLDPESRLRRYAKAFRREANPPTNLSQSLIAGLGDRARRESPMGMVPAVAMAGLVLVGGLVLAFGAWQLRNLGRPTSSPPVAITTTTPSATQTPSPTATASPSASPTPTATAAPTAGPQPGLVPGLNAIQMVGARLGWAVGSQGIYVSTDGTHWTKQYSSAEQFIGVDFVSSTTGWAVGANTLLRTTDGGKSWHQLDEPPQPLRSVHFAGATQGWGIAGGSDPLGAKTAGTGAVVVASRDGGASWSVIQTPTNPQSVCFTDGSHGWLATQAGRVYRSQNGGQSWAQSLQMVSSQPGLSGTARIECAGPTGLWVQWAPGGAAAGHVPYVIYATVNGQSWRTVMAEPGTIGNQLPGVPAGPGSYPGSFSVVDASDAVFVGDTPPADSAATMIATNGGATLKSTGNISGAPQTFDAAFVSTSTGWVLAQNNNGQVVVERTTDGGYHWSQQLAVPTAG
jgi:photosystem II stability/assembly factor-like uncharacterized protein